MPKLNLLAPLVLFMLSACAPVPATPERVVIPTATLAPIASQPPRLTATSISTRKPLPTFTPIPPTPSETPTHTDIPPIIAMVNAQQNVNVRSGPGVDFSDIIVLAPTTRVEVLGQSSDGRWYNVLMNDGQEGWVAASLLSLLPTPTPPVMLFAQTPTPVSASATLPPSSANTTPDGYTVTPSPTPSATSSLAVDASVLPVIDMLSIEQTATALSGFIVPTATRPPATQALTLSPVATMNGTAQARGASVQKGVDVLAYCDNPALGTPPTTLAAGSTIDIVWRWFAITEQQVLDHLAASLYSVELDDVPIRQLNSYRSSIKQGANGYFVEWYVPTAPLEAGEHVITYSVTWTTRVFDGYAYFGPGSATLTESGTCTFTVQ